MRMMISAVVLGFSCLLAGCNGDKAASGGSAAPAGDGSKKPNTSLTNKQLEDAFKSGGVNDSFEKKLASVTAALGKPTKMDGDTSIWLAWKPKEGKVDQDCIKLAMNKLKGNSIGGTDWKECGMGN